MVKETNRYRVVDESQILEDDLTKDEADYFFSFLSSIRDMNSIKIEKYFPFSHRLGRDPDIH